MGRIRELIIDNGSEFGAHRKEKKGNWNSEFKREVGAYGIMILKLQKNISRE